MLLESWRLGVPMGLSHPLGCPRALWLLMLLSQSTAPHWDEGWDTAASQLMVLPLPQTVPSLGCPTVGSAQRSLQQAGARESAWDKSSWAVKHHRVELWLTEANKHLQQHPSHTDTQPRSCIPAPKPNSHSAQG